MDGGLLLADLALVDQRLDPAVVVGELLELAVAQQVGPAVADVGQAELGAVEQGAGDRGAHAVERGVGLDQVGDPVVGLVTAPASTSSIVVAVVDSSMRRMSVSTATAEARSPAAAPPMPSATTSRAALA